MPPLLDIINPDGQVISRGAREKIHEQGWWHRGVHVLVFNREGELLLQKRSADKDKFPCRLDVSLSEHVHSGERYEDAARRGLEEELGIRGAAVAKLIRFKLVYGPNDNKISEIYQCRYDGPIAIDRTEVETVEFVPLHRIKPMLRRQGKRFAPWAREILGWLVGQSSRLEVEQ
jgi:isopentenyldiphosphate isomerase